MKFRGNFKKKFPQKKDAEKEIDPTTVKEELIPLPDGVKSILSVNGYSLPKVGTPSMVLSKIRRDLLIEPFVERPEYGTNITPIKIYEETEKRIYMPRYYGISTFGMPKEDKLTYNTKIVRDLEGLALFNPTIKLRDIQIPIVDKMVNHLTTKFGGTLSCYCGFGKCLGKGTPIIMYDGRIKKVEDIVVGDKLMGDDSQPRNVLSLARGREMMYKITPKKGDSYVVNESHILSLHANGNKTISKYMKKGEQFGWYVKYYDHETHKMKLELFSLLDCVTLDDAYNSAINFVNSVYSPNVRDIPLKTYLNLPEWERRNLRGYRVPVSFDCKDVVVDVDPYIFGYGLNNKTYIPSEYKCNDRQIQLQVLAGLIDSNGQIQEKCYQIMKKSKTLASDIVFLCRSLGFAAYISECCESDGMEMCWRITISGEGLEEIPVKIECKKMSASASTQNKNVLITDIKVEKLDVDDYYGFTLDGNHRFLLGDFQVTHNTLSALKICSILKVKTAVICHTSDLLNQWKEEIVKLLPCARIGLVQQNNCIMKDKDIILISLKTLAMHEFPEGTFDDIGLSIWDEIHLMVTQLFSKAFMKMITPYTFGLSATPYRKDKCEKIFYNFIGPIVHFEKRGPNNTVKVDCIVYKAQELIIEKDFKDDILYTTTVTKMCYNLERIMFIAKMIIKIASQVGRKILVLSEYVQHLKEIKTAVEQLSEERIKTNVLAKKIVCGLYIGEMKNDERVVSRESDVILGTFKIASVGMDIPDLNTLILASPRKEIEQSVGRIFRKVGALKPKVIDIIDDHPMFISQGRIRKEFYKEYEFTILQSKVDWTGKVSSQRVIFDATQTKKIKKVKTIESLMSEDRTGEQTNRKDDDADADDDDSDEILAKQMKIEEMLRKMNGENNRIEILPEEKDEESDEDKKDKPKKK